MLKLQLKAIDPCLGIYDVKGVPHKSMPERMRYLHPHAATAFQYIASVVVVSDMFRSPESSLAAVRSGRGAKRPGFSAHNYGLAIDIDIGASMRGKEGLKSKLDLDRFMSSFGWFCHRQDHKVDFEAWHYNFLDRGALPKGQTTSDEVEQRILDLYGDALRPDDTECQRMLSKIRMYGGEADGIVGPRTREAVRVFKRAWGLLPDDHLDEMTRRTLAYVSCDHYVEHTHVPA